MQPRTLSARDAAALVPDRATVAISGSGGGILEADEVVRAVRERFDGSGRPHGITVVHAFGIGHPTGRGLELWADPRLVRRVIGGHWSWSPTMQQLAATDQIEAYALPSGVISLLLREIGARRPGLITRTGLRTYVDPRQSGGRCNAVTLDEIVDVVTIADVEYLHYKPFSVDVGLIRGTYADADGNITCREEPAALDVLAVAMAAKASGGRVIAQVRDVVPTGSIDPWTVAVPGNLVDAVVVSPHQWQSYESRYEPSFAGLATDRDRVVDVTEASHRWAGMSLRRNLIAGRAARESRLGDRTNVGFGISADVVTALAARGRLDDIRLLIEQGAIGGEPIGGELFGVSRDFVAMLTSTAQFDLFGGGALDRAYLGMAEVDASGAVNVSRIAGRLVGPGGFIDISQNAREAVFCGTFTTGGLELATDGQELRVVREGRVRKLVSQVDHVTYSGQFARIEGRGATYVTERATFVLGPDGLELTELVAGVDLEGDVLAQMDFRPVVRDPRVVSVSEYAGGPVPVSEARPASAVATEVR